MSKLFGIGAAMAVALLVGMSSTPSYAQAGRHCGLFLDPPCGTGFQCIRPALCPHCEGVCKKNPKQGPHSVRKHHK